MRYLLLAALAAFPVILSAAPTTDRQLMIEEQRDAARQQLKDLKERTQALEKELENTRKLEKKQDRLIRALRAEINRTRGNDHGGKNRAQRADLDRDSGSPASP